MPLTVQELLHPQIITKKISQISIGKSPMAEHYGFLHDGPAVKVEGIYATYRIYNGSREPLVGRLPGAGPAATPPNPVGMQQVAMAHFWEKIPLEGFRLGHLSKIEGPNSALDVGGVNYIQQQTNFLGFKINSVDAALTGGFMRGTFYLNQSGDNWNVAYSSSGTSITVNLQMPSGQKTQLNMLGEGSIIDVSWDNPAAPIVTHCYKVNRAMQHLYGMPLEEVVVGSTVWNHVINNTQVRTIGGTVQSPIDAFNWVDDKVDGSKRRKVAKARLKALPWVDWIVTDEVVALGGGGDPVSGGTATRTALIADTAAVFQPAPERDWCEMYHGGLLVSEDYGKPAKMKIGFSTWSRWDIEPTTCNIHAMYTAMPVAYRTAHSYGTVVF